MIENARHSHADGNIPISGLSNDARGVGRDQRNKTVFVKGALPGEEVTYRVSKSHNRFDEADIVDIIEPSPYRTDPECKHFTSCGGCSLQHLAPEKQIDLKQSWLSDQLHKFAKVQPKAWAKPLRGESWGYRYRARLGVKWIKAQDKLLIGFREEKGNHLVDITECQVLHPAIGHQIGALRKLLECLSVGHECSHISISATEDQVALNFRLLADPTESDLALLGNFGQRFNFIIYLQLGDTSSIALHHAPDDYQQLQYWVNSNTQLAFEPQHFTQVNPQMNKAMIAQAIDWMQLTNSDRVLDLFCGIGNFSLPIARQVTHVTGVEGNSSAIESAISNANKNGLSANTDFYVADLFADQYRSKWVNQSYTQVLLDPPRAGAREILPLITKKIKPKKILYVSCDPATLARDIGMLTEQGYKLKRAGVMDMFPHTAHVESMALLTKKS